MPGVVHSAPAVRSDRLLLIARPTLRGTSSADTSTSSSEARDRPIPAGGRRQKNADERQFIRVLFWLKGGEISVCASSSLSAPPPPQPWRPNNHVPRKSSRTPTRSAARTRRSAPGGT